MSARDEAARLAVEIKQAMAEDGVQPVSYAWSVDDFGILSNMVDAGDVEVLTVVRRTLLPLRQEYPPGLIGAAMTSLRSQEIESPGELVTRDALDGCSWLFKAINDFGRSVGIPVLTDDDRAVEVFLMPFTDPDMTGEVIALVRERGLMPAAVIRGLVHERRVSVPALHEGAL